MKKTKPSKPVVRNLVAKHAALIHKPKVFKCKKKDYQRHPKHRDLGCSVLGVTFLVWPEHP